MAALAPAPESADRSFPGSLEKLADFLEETITKLVGEAERSRMATGT